ncbi:MAG: molecular chaperone HtpG [Proteobacteria bacterium]|nr:molecular chaperone HtpG [Pseudomonadota bacterium]
MSTNKGETRQFTAEVGKVLQLMIHSLYTNKEIAIRELISNASDACDKLRYNALSQPELLGEDNELKITVELNRANNTIAISDNGIGMDHDELIQNLGTVASSGTQRFLTAVANNQAAPGLIGQFGVGFYSAFMIADKVTVYSTKAGYNQTYQWESEGSGEYTLSQLEEPMSRGTKIMLHLKSDAEDFADRHRVGHIIKTYSDHIEFPITVDDGEGHLDVTNLGAALWTKDKSDITEDQYTDFYHYTAHSPDTPWMRVHYKAEGAVEYTTLLFVPSVRPFDLFNPDRKGRVRLYVKKVFISEDIPELLPSYLRFIRGVIDSSDLPLNISRETLQHNSVVGKIRKSIVKKILGLLKQKAAEDKEEYAKFWNNFGEVMREGLCESALEEKEQLLEVCRFQTTKSDGDIISLEEYIDRMAEGQEQIFYLNGDDMNSLKSNPQLEGFKQRNIEVILLADQVDDFWVNVIHQYKNKELCSITNSSIDLDAIYKLEQLKEEGLQDPQQDVEALLTYCKEVLGDRVRSVKVSSKLVDSPACLAIPDGGMNIRMEKFLLAQRQLKKGMAKILELNLQHPIMKRIAKDVVGNCATEETKTLVRIVFDQACIFAGETMEDPVLFTQGVNALISKAIA